MDIEKVKRYSLIEVVLLAVLVMGLLIANLIVKRRARISLSDPIPLFGSGLSVSMPVNTGWDHTDAWQYEESENCMTLVAQFRNRSRGAIEVRWRYLLSTPAGTEPALLKQRALYKGFVIQQTDTIGQGPSMVFARMQSESGMSGEVFYLGIMRLDHNRSVELLIKSFGMNILFEEAVFKSLAGSIQYETPQKLVTGHTLIDEFLKSQAQALKTNRLTDEAYLIKESASGVNLGYYTARHSSYSDQQEVLRRTQIRQFEYKNMKLESTLWFNPFEKEYRWKSDILYSGMVEPQVYAIEIDETGQLLVKCNVGKTKIFPGDQFLLPEPLLPELASMFLQSKHDSVIIDVQGMTGQLVPVYLEKISPQQAKAKSEDTDAVVRIVYLHAQGSFEELFFDDEQNLLGKFEQQPRRRGRIWDTVPIEELQRIFQTDFKLSAESVACGG